MHIAQQEQRVKRFEEDAMEQAMGGTAGFNMNGNLEQALSEFWYVAALRKAYFRSALLRLRSARFGRKPCACGLCRNYENANKKHVVIIGRCTGAV